MGAIAQPQPGLETRQIMLTRYRRHPIVRATVAAELVHAYSMTV